jgi:hypothetical protein
MKEKMLVLGIAEPRKSSTYEMAICVAGITTSGRFRRLYSVPMSHYICRPFKKYQYISYDVTSKSDRIGRPESRKVDYHSIEPSEFASPSTITDKIRSNTSDTIDYLHQRKKMSLAIIKPFEIKTCTSERRYKRSSGRFTRLRGKTSNTINLLPFTLRMNFRCRPKCKSHNIMCEDIEIGNYYRKLLLNYNQLAALEKVEERIFSYFKESTPYFLMGTHVQHKTWLIISLINQKAEHYCSTSSF